MRRCRPSPSQTDPTAVGGQRVVACIIDRGLGFVLYVVMFVALSKPIPADLRQQQLQLLLRAVDVPELRQPLRVGRHAPASSSSCSSPTSSACSCSSAASPVAPWA